MSAQSQPAAQRLPQFELLRVLCMFGIVVNHFFTYGLDIYGLNGSAFTVPVDGFLDAALWGVLEGTKLLSLVSVNCFVLITGYFLTYTTDFRLKGIFRVWMQTVFYGLVVYLLMVAAGLEAFSLQQAVRFFFPVATNRYWFITTYIALMAVAPFLSRMVSGIDRRTYCILLAVGFVLCFQYPFGEMFVDSQQLVLFIYLFLVGGYIRRFASLPCLSRTRCAILSVCLFLAMMAVAVVKNLMDAHEPFLVYAMGYTSLVLPFSICLFFIIARAGCPVAISRVLPAVSPYVLAVYLIHSHPHFQNWMWHSIGQSVTSLPLTLMPLLCLAWSALIFVLCIAVERVRHLFSGGKF